jgi:hypothetical protein
VPAVSTVTATASVGLVAAGLQRGYTPGGTTQSVTGLIPGQLYRARVRARDAAGNFSAWSDFITFTTMLAPAVVAATVSIPTPTVTTGGGVTRSPATVAATAGIPTPTIPVPANQAPATVTAVAAIGRPGAGLQRSFTPTGTTQALTGLQPGSQYAARVRARDAAGNWSAWTEPLFFTTTAAGLATVAATTSIPGPTVGGTPPTVTAGRARPVVVGQGVLLDVTATPPGGQSISGYSWAIQGGGAGSLTNATTATPTYTAPGSGSGVVTVRATVFASGGGTSTADLTVSYHSTIVAAENALTGTARATWDLASPNLGGVSTLQGFCDGFTVDKTGTASFKIAQSDAAGWSAEVYRLGWYGGDGARSYGTLTPDGTQLTASQSQPSPGDTDTSTTLLSADAGNWATTLTWTPPAWAPSGIYVLRLNRTGGGASHVMFIVRDDARAADLMLMPSDSTWNAYNAWGGMGGSMYSGNSLYFGTAVDQYNGDCARFVSYNRPLVNRGAADSGRTYGAVEWSTFFTGEYPMVRFVERNGIDAKYYGCIDAAGDSTGIHLAGNGSTRGGTSAAMFVGHNEYWSDGMRAGWEAARDAGVSLFSCAGNEVFWRTYGTNPDSDGRPRTFECQKSTIGGRGNTRPQWTGSWRDPDGAGKGGNNPENRLTGTIFVVNGPDLRALQVPFAGGYSAQPIWRHTSVAGLTTGQTFSSPSQILGFEWDTYGPAGVSTTAASYLAAPHARTRYCSDATYSINSGLLLTDAGDEYNTSGTATHRLVVYPGGNGAIVFGTGTINWALGCDDANTYQLGNDNTSLVIQQATVNMLTDMGAPPVSLMAGLTQPTAVDWFIEPTTVAATATIPAVSVSTGGGATRTPVTVQATTTIPAPATAAGATRAPASVAASAAIASPAVAAGATRAPATVTATTTVPAPAVSAGGGTTVSPTTVAAAAAVPAPTVAGSSGATAAPATLVATASIGAPVVQVSKLTAPASVPATTSIPTPAAGSGAVRTLTTVAGVAAIATPTLLAQAHASRIPATVMALASIPQPQVTTSDRWIYRPYAGVITRPDEGVILRP